MDTRIHRGARIRRIICMMSAAAVLCCLVTAGGTAALLTDSTDDAVNTFVPGTVSCTIEETFDGVTKEDAGVRNTGNIDAYIRAALIPTWMLDGDDSDMAVYGLAPEEGWDYRLVLNTADWFAAADGYYYYRYPVAPGERTAALVESCTVTEVPPPGCFLSLEIVASAIQATPVGAVAAAWGVTVAADGGISQ